MVKILASIIAKCWPKQFLGPALNGNNKAPFSSELSFHLYGINF
jgi:hypothetical protein